MRIIITAAFMQEAESFIKNDGLERVRQHPFQVYESESYSLLITGPGKANAAAALSFILEDSEKCHVINAGTAGALKSGILEGSVFGVSRIYEADRALFSGEKRFHNCGNRSGFKDAVCLCRDNPVIDDEERQIYSSDADIADMESAAVFQVCRLFRADCSIIKIVSDVSGSESGADIAKKIALFSGKLYESVREFMKII